MNYQFPEIRTINDVLPHIEGCKEFVVAERDGFTVINYNVTMPDTFPPIKVAGGSAKQREARSLTNRMRRECRGLKFHTDGKIAARPFFKFFNVGERDETQIKNIDFSQPHNIEEKRDGSMLHPFLLDGGIRWMTKMGLSDVALQAEEFINTTSNYVPFARYCIDNGLTCIFEYTSPDNKIVVDYDQPALILLSVRNNITGNFLNIHGD
jgi:RNA ligase